MNLHELQERFNNFDLRDEVLETIVDTADEIATLNAGQMFIGKLSTGKPIQNIKTHRFDYSVWWGEHRLDLGLQVDYFDFKVTGRFYRSLFVREVTRQTFTIASDDNPEKVKTLETLFTDEIYGLTDESLDQEYIPLYFFPELKKRIEQKLGVVMI